MSPLDRRTGALLFVLFAFAVSFSARGEEWRLRVVGNLAFGAEWTPILQREGARYPFQEIEDFLRGAERTIGYLEGPIAAVGEPMPGVERPLRSSPVVALALQVAGFDALSLATPHMLDFGPEALAATKVALDEHGIVPFGAGANEAEARKAGRLTVGEVTVACLGYLHGIQPSHATEFRAGTNPSLPSFIREDVARAREEADVVLVFFHWGERPGDRVDGRQRRLAQMAIDAGATAVFGLRDQTWQGVEVYRDRPILYSLADFVRGTGAKRFGRLLVPTLLFDGAALRRIEWRAVRVDVALKVGEDPGLRLQPRLLPPEEAREPIDAFLELSRALGTDLTPTETGAILELPTTSETEEAHE